MIEPAGAAGSAAAGSLVVRTGQVAPLPAPCDCYRATPKRCSQKASGPNIRFLWSSRFPLVR
jgi:hypothetical protein